MAGKWTRDDIIRQVLDREAKGLSLTTGGRSGLPNGLHAAGIRFFGSWRNTLVAAGINPAKTFRRTRWTPNRILAVIRNLSRRRDPLNQQKLLQRHGGLVVAARRHFGSWNGAIMAAGVNPARMRRVNPWTRERVVEAILKRALVGEPLKGREGDLRMLIEAGVRLFGSWPAAIAAAGVQEAALTAAPAPPSREKPAPPRKPRVEWSAERIQATIEERRQAGKRVNVTSVRREQHCLFLAAKRVYGTWEQALTGVLPNFEISVAAGLDRQDGH
jgi:hypothetical protein